MSVPWQGADLLQPVTPDSPCGENLEDTPLLAAFDAFRLFGRATPLDPPPDWEAIRSKAAEALGRSKDLRLLAHLSTALLRTARPEAFTETLVVAAQWLETYWAGVYPLVDEDAIPRRSALNCLADPMAVIDGLRRAPLVSSRQHGTFSLRDIDIATGQAPPSGEEARPEEARIAAAFAEMPLEDLEGLQRSVAGGVEAVKRIDTAMAEHAGRDSVPTLDALSTQLIKMDRVLRAHLSSRVDAGAGAGDMIGRSVEVVETGQIAAVGAIKSRQDAIRALDAVAAFFRHNEPSSPIPLFVERAKRLVSRDFLEVLADIVPEAVPRARSAGGLPEAE